MLKCWKIGFWQNNDWIWVNEKCSQFWENMFGRHTILNVKYSGNHSDMKYFCDLNIFGFISNHFWHLHFWTYCRWLFNFDPKTTFKLSGSELNIKVTKIFHISLVSWILNIYDCMCDKHISPKLCAFFIDSNSITIL